MTRPPPILRWCIVCRQVVVDEFTGQQSLISIADRLPINPHSLFTERLEIALSFTTPLCEGDELVCRLVHAQTRATAWSALFAVPPEHGGCTFVPFTLPSLKVGLIQPRHTYDFEVLMGEVLASQAMLADMMVDLHSEQGGST